MQDDRPSVPLAGARNLLRMHPHLDLAHLKCAVITGLFVRVGYGYSSIQPNDSHLRRSSMKRLLGVVFVCAMFSTPLFAGKLFGPKGTTVKISDAVAVGTTQIAA